MKFLLWTAIILGAVVGVMRYVAIRWWRVPDNDPFLEASISPTLRGGDLVILWRLTKAAYGDLVVCPEPEAPERIVIGRIAGDARDKIRLENGGIIVNNKLAGTERPCEHFTVNNPNSGREVDQRCDVEVLGGKGHTRGSIAGQKIPLKVIERTVPEGKIFLLSDNRLYPYDSRDFGFVDPDTCKEMVLFRLLSKEGFSDQESRFTFIQ